MTYLKASFLLTFICLFHSNINSQGIGELAKAFVKIFVKEDGTKTVSVWEKAASKTKFETPPKFKFESTNLYDDLKKKFGIANSKEMSYTDLLKIIEEQKLYADVLISPQEVYELETKAKMEALVSAQAETNRERDAKRIIDELSKPISITSSKPVLPIPSITLKNVDNTEVFLSIPSNVDEFKNIFGKENFNKRQLYDAARTKKVLVQEKNKNVKFSSSATEFVDNISKIREVKNQ